MKFCTLVVVVHFFRSASNTIDCWKKKLWDVSHFCDDRIDHHIAHSWCWTLFHFTTPKLLPYLCMRMCVLVSMIFFPKISFGINITKKKKPIDSSTLCVCQVDQFHDRKQKKSFPPMTIGWASPVWEPMEKVSGDTKGGSSSSLNISVASRIQHTHCVIWTGCVRRRIRQKKNGDPLVHASLPV